MQYRVFANHAHIFPGELRPSGTVEALKKLMDECSIEKAVCFAPFQDRFSESSIGGSSVVWLAEQIKDNPSFVGFGTIEFESGDLAGQVERIAQLGFKGIKIHPAYQEINIMGENACAVYEKAQELGLFLSFHTGIHWHRIRDYNMLLFDEVAFNFPELKFSMEHLGGYHFFREGLAVMCNNSRKPTQTVFAGWTSIDAGDNGLPGAWTISDLELRTIIHQTGEHRSIFGLDFPYNDAENTKRSIERIMNLEIPDSAKEGILGRNLAEVLGVEF